MADTLHNSGMNDPDAVMRLERGIRCIRAPNPTAMTHTGTNTYLVGTGSVAVIDPGPDDPSHLDAILRATEDETVSHIFVTHAHRDHSELSAGLAAATGAKVYGFGPAEAGRSDTMQALAASGLIGGGEGVNHTFDPDVTLTNGDVVEGAGWSLTALWTPGHFSGHLCFDWDGHVFTGDHVMGWASTMISPPDGDVTAFMASCAVLRQRGAIRYYPGHGPMIDNPIARLEWLMRHRREREGQILAALGRTPLELTPLTRRIYYDAPHALMPAAERNVLAHLIDLEARSLVRALPDLNVTARFVRN